MEKLWFTPAFMQHNGELNVVLFVEDKNRDHPSVRLLETFCEMKLMYCVQYEQDHWVYALTRKGKDFLQAHISINALCDLAQMAEEGPDRLNLLWRALEAAGIKAPDFATGEAVVWN